jgi:hypothetical protein
MRRTIARTLESTGNDRAVALAGLIARIAHLSYANLAGIATFLGRYVVGGAQTAGKRDRPRTPIADGSHVTQCRSYASRVSVPR